jgi:lipopolysaccharide export system permease protein
VSSVQGRVAAGGLLRFLIIDRYMLRQFLQTFLICFCSLTGLFIVIDGFGNLEEFIRFAPEHGGLLAVMGEYYAYRSLAFFDTTSHILTLIAAMFTVTWIQRHNELTALESAGIPKLRVIRPVIIAAVVISLLSAANRELIIPSVREPLSHNAQDLEGSAAKPLTPRYDVETDVWIGGWGSEMQASEQRIHKPDFHLPVGLDRYGSRLVADDAWYQPAQADHPGGYLFRKVTQPKGLDSESSLSLGERAVLLTPRDHGWLKPGECFVASNVSFDDLESGNSWKLSSTLDMIRGLRNRSLDFGAEARLAIHARIVQPVLDVTLLFLGLPLVLSRSNRNVFLAIGMCLVLVVAFMLVVLACQTLGTNYWLEPALAAWLPLMIFVPCAVGLFQPLRE